jgi:hypothetical protein
MGNHFHILVRMFPEHEFTDEDIQSSVGSKLDGLLPKSELACRFDFKQN